MMRSRALLWFGLSVLLTAIPKPGAASAPVSYAMSRPNAPSPQASTKQAQAPAVQRANGFAIDLFRSAVTANHKATENVAMSPLGIEAAVVAMNAGAKGATADEMNAVLRVPPTGDVFDAYTDVLAPGRRNNSFTLDLSTRIWAAQGAAGAIEPSYTNACARLHCEAPAMVDFHQPDAVVRDVNDWIATKTNHRIENLIDKQSIDPKMLLLLGNAVYFKANWNSKFLPARTEQADFFVSDKEKSRVSMMHSAIETNGYASFPDCDVVQMQYEQPSNLTFVVVLPKPNVSLSTVEQKLTRATWDEWMDGLRGRQVDLFLPRFKAQSHLMLGNTLTSLGMKRAFSAEADFTGLINKPGVFFSDVLHGASVEIDEQGTVAAAATITAFVMAAPSGEKETPVVFRADRPFLYAIRDRRNGALLFIGHVTKP